MTITNAFLRHKIALCVIAIPTLWGCAGTAPTRSGEGAGPKPKIVITAGEGGSGARVSELLATLVEADITKENARITTEYLPETTIADEQGAANVGRAHYANVVVWSREMGDGSAELQITVVQPRADPGTTGAVTLSIPWEGGNRKELYPGEGDAQVEPPAAPEDVGWVPVEGGGATGDVGPIPTAPGKWDPPGDQPGNFFYGRNVHNSIASFYFEQHRSDVVHLNDVPINTIAGKAGLGIPKAFGEKKGLFRPDIFNATKQHLYEIKPSKLSEMVDGVAKAGVYYAALKEVGFSKVKLGPTGEPGTSGMVSAPGGYAYFSVVVPGLIAYQGVRNKPKDFSKLFLSIFSYALLEQLRKHYAQPPAPPVPAPPPAPPPVTVPTLVPVLPPPISVPVLLQPTEPVSHGTVKARQESMKQQIALAMYTTLAVAGAVLLVAAAMVLN